jgi:hypothetical protein
MDQSSFLGFLFVLFLNNLFIFLALLEFELRALRLLHRHSMLEPLTIPFSCFFFFFFFLR